MSTTETITDLTADQRKQALDNLQRAAFNFRRAVARVAVESESLLDSVSRGSYNLVLSNVASDAVRAASEQGILSGLREAAIDLGVDPADAERAIQAGLAEGAASA